MKRFAYKIGVIGAGNMGGALIRGLIGAKVIRPHQLIASDKILKKLRELRRTYGIKTTLSNLEVIQKAKSIIVAVKPQEMNEVFPQLRGFLNKGQLILSIVTGVDTKKFKREIGRNIIMGRVMPNLPALIGKGVSGIYFTKGISKNQKRLAHQIFDAVGSSVEIAKEQWADCITGLSGTGPAYLFALMEGLIVGGKKAGLPYELAKKLTLETMTGAAQMVLKTKLSPEELRAKVTSKKGTTWAAMKVFKKRRFWDTVSKAVITATERARFLRGK